MQLALAKKSAVKSTSLRLREDKAAVILQKIMKYSLKKKLLEEKLEPV